MAWFEDEFPQVPKEVPQGDSPETDTSTPVVDPYSSGVSVPHNVKDRNKGVGLRL